MPPCVKIVGARRHLSRRSVSCFLQVMSAQDERPLPTANGVTPDRQVADAGTSQSTAVTGNVSTLEERADGPVDATMLEPTGQAAYTPEAPPTYHNPAPGDESVQQQERQRRPATTVALDGDQDSGRVVQGAVASGSRAVDFLTPRSAMTTASTAQNNWIAGLEVPRWVSRLGSYLAQGRGDFAPSPLAGSAMSSPSPPGGPTFRLRSPAPTGRPVPPPTPPSSEISAEAIQAEVQRQLGGLLGRLQAAESRNDALMSELGEARRSLEAARSQRQGGLGALWDPLPRVPVLDVQGSFGVLGGQQQPDLWGSQVGLPQGASEPPNPPRLLEDLLSAPSGPSVQPQEPRPTIPDFGTTNAVPKPPPLPEQRGFVRSFLGPSRARSETPPPRTTPTTAAGQDESPVMNAVLKGVQQLQELQAAAMTRTQTPAAEVIKPGTTTLAQLPDLVPGAETAMKFQDWLELTTAVMCDVSEQSSLWWRKVLEEVETTYKRWLASTPLERLSLAPQGDGLAADRWTRLNARVSAMVLASMSKDLQADMVAHRISTSTVRMLYRLHTLFQPGGSHEREDILRKLQNPAENAANTTLGEVLRILRAWPRWMTRCATLQMTPPDSSVLARGLKLLTGAHLEQSQDAAFRTAMVRTSLRLDGQPRMEDVYAYQRHLQAEVENLLASRPAASMTTTVEEAPRLRALDRNQPQKDKEKSDRQKDKGSSGELCRYFLRPTGCKRGTKCSFSHSMSTLDRETRNKKCLLCGAEGHRQRDCTVGKTSRTTTTPASPTNKDQRQQQPSTPGISSVSTTTPSSTVDSNASGTTSTIQGVPWTLENLIQAAQQVVQNQGAASGGESSPEKTAKPGIRTMVVKDVRICSVGSSSAALLDSGATHCLRNAYDYNEWDASESVMVHLAGNNKLVMKLSRSGSLLMPPRTTSSTTTEASTGQTIVPMGELVRTLGYTLIWGPEKCYLEDAAGERTALNVSTGCPQLCEAAALALIAKLEDRKREQLENETLTTMDAVTLATINMSRSWWDYVQEYAESGNKEAGLRGLRDAPFLQGLPGESLGGMVQEAIHEQGSGT